MSQPEEIDQFDHRKGESEMNRCLRRAALWAAPRKHQRARRLWRRELLRVTGWRRACAATELQSAQFDLVLEEDSIGYVLLTIGLLHAQEKLCRCEGNLHPSNLFELDLIRSFSILYPAGR